MLVLKPKEAAEELRIGIATMMDKLHSGEIPAYKDGADWKIPSDLLKKYVEEKALAEAKERSRNGQEKISVESA
mgnify:CR=1 FL=1